MKSQRPLSPHLQIYKFQYTMTLSIVHRITGLLLSAASLLLVYWLWAIASGAEQYERTLKCLSSGWVKALLVGAMFCFFYHLSNGLRHLAWDLGYGFEKRQARPSGWAVVVAAVVLTAIGAYFFLRMTGQAVGGEV
jgi:succinate dehydrogenase / fumarate reductase cytochrome b subunit